MSQDTKEVLENVDAALEAGQTEEEQMLDLRKSDPMEIIKAAAEGMGIILNDPKPNCKKCYGRGYIGRRADTGEPIPCTCIYPKYDREMGAPMMWRPRNRKERRHGF